MGDHNLPPSADYPGAVGTRRAAVLAPLQRRGEQWHLLLIKRAERHGDRHSGQVAFPGGGVEPQDPSVTAAALREAEEEIGLTATHVDIIGQLPDYNTVSDYVVSPVVGVVTKPFQPQLQETEVAKLFSIPVAWLANPENHEKRVWSPSRPRVVYFRDWEGETLWGATAAMTLHLLSALDQGQIALPTDS